MLKFPFQVSKHRTRILELFENPRTWTLAELERALPKIDKSTIFRNLLTFQKNGLIQVAHIHDKQKHFEKTQPHHAHLLCQKCHIDQCIPCLVKAETRPHQLEIQDFCLSCR